MFNSKIYLLTDAKKCIIKKKLFLPYAKNKAILKCTTKEQLCQSEVFITN